MNRAARWYFVLLALWACGDKAAAPSPAPAPVEVPAPQPATNAPVVSPPSAPNPCDKPEPITLTLNAGTSQETPWGLEFRYVVDEDKKLGSGYLFQLRSGDRRWESRRDNRNWNQPITWRGYCWRGASRPARRALSLQVQVAPVCKDGRLQELGGCGNTLGAE